MFLSPFSLKYKLIFFLKGLNTSDKVINDKERLRSCSRLKVTKEV